MKFFRNMLVGLAGLIAILVVVGLFLPRALHVERVSAIGAPAEPVYAVLSDFRRFNDWSPWFALDPDAEYVVSNPGRGEGASFAWRSERPGVGSGGQQIIEAQENSLVRIRLDFGAQGSAVSMYTLEPSGRHETRVTWAMDTDFGYDLVGRYVGLLLKRRLGEDLERGLARLKALVESEYAAAVKGASDSPGDPDAPRPRTDSQPDSGTGGE